MWRAPRGCTTRRARGSCCISRPGAAGVIEMHVGRDDEVDRVAREPGGGERGEQARHRVVGAGVDEGGAAALDDQVRGVEERPVKAGVDDTDAVGQRFDEGGRCRRGGGRVGHEGVSRGEHNLRAGF